ncbi:universal stress protein [Pontibacillus yanchengensis]|uniref:Universal stress protein n=2 Tax=Pontibacillus yanchengensis TaxID=462910 RepID=A0A6I5A4P5_9BACI|nr:universal stress protein [Pontibacillus yanchengensis]
MMNIQVLPYNVCLNGVEYKYRLLKMKSKNGKEGGSPMKNSIIVPVDGSPHSFFAMTEALDLSKRLEMNIVLVNVQHQIETLHTKMFFSSSDVNEYQNQLATEELKEVTDFLDKQQFSYEKVVRIGYPIHEICKEAEERGAKYIIIGSRGRGPLRGQMFGSVSLGVLHEANCPVLVVKGDKDKANA